MKKLSVKSIIDFRKKSDRGKKNFAINLKQSIEKAIDEGGGDYWISCVSSISNAFKENDKSLVKDKIEELEQKLEETPYTKTKTMYQRNIDILYNYEDVNFKRMQPSGMQIIKKKKANSILTIKGLQIEAKPNHVFTFKTNDIDEIGAIWFIAKLGGYSKDELGMFAEMLYRYLKVNFSTKYVINTKYCIAIDITSRSVINYSQIQKGDVPAIFIPTIDEIRSLM